jgi:hypothetical protein
MAAKKTPSSLEGLTFYMVPSSWLAKAWPMLDARPTTVVSTAVDDYGKWRENVGIIQTSELLSTNHTVSSDEEGTENGNRKPANGTNLSQQQAPQSVSLRTDLKHGLALRAGLKHGVDYFLLGPSTWLLVKEKFGFDKEIGRPCVFHSTNYSTLSVAVDKQQPTNGGTPNNQATQHSLIPIPPAGYFPYKQLLSDLEGESEETFLPQPARQQALAHFEPHQRAPDTTQTTVSDDEGGENDLVRSFHGDVTVQRACLTVPFLCSIQTPTPWLLAVIPGTQLNMNRKARLFCCLRPRLFRLPAATTMTPFIHPSRIWNVETRPTTQRNISQKTG